MTKSAEHPSDYLLQAYLHGRLPLEHAAELDRHIESCESCGRRLASVGSDTFSDLLREATTEIQTGPLPATQTELPHELRNHSRYEIQERLGRGGMGVVYKAVHRMMHRPVALKLIRSELLSSPEAVERFRREVRAAAKLAHPNIVAAYDAEEVAGVHFLVMEYVDGKTLDAIVRKRGPLPVPTACHLARQAALGLEHAHALGMVHRDIKPLNLILADKSKVKILDFGLALWQGPGEGLEPSTKEGQALGTLLYSAPEQRQSAGTVDARADIYSLGATLAFLLTGQPPQKAEWPDSIPQGLQEILSRLMAKTPADRFPTAKAVAEALSPWCSRKPPTLETKPVSRKYRVAAVAALVLLATAVGIWAWPRDRSSPAPALVPVVDTPPERPWRSLLRPDMARHAVNGDWQMTNGELRILRRRPPPPPAPPPDLGYRIEIPGTLPAEYDLRVTFTRIAGKHSVGAIVVQNGHQVVFEVDCWEQQLGGFQNIDGRTMVDNPTRRNGIRLNNGQRYTMLVEVRRESLCGWLDNLLVAKHRTDGRDLSVDPRYWTIPNKSSLGLVAYDSYVAFHSIELKDRTGP